MTRNVFDHCTGSAIKTETDGCFWFEGHPVSNWTVTYNSFVGVNYATATMPGDVEVDYYVPKMSADGKPTTTCEQAAPAPLHFGLTVSHNTYFQDAGSSALAMFAASGATVSNNSVTRAPGTPVPAFDFGCTGCALSNASANVCNGGACRVAGL